MDAATGIFVTTEFEAKKNALSPLLVVTCADESNTVYENIKNALECGEDDSLVVYSMNNRVTPISSYTITIPLSPEHINGKTVEFYSYTADDITKLAMTKDDNMFTGETDSIEYIAVLIKPAFGSDVMLIPVIIATAAVVAAGVAAVAVFVKRKREGKL